MQIPNPQNRKRARIEIIPLIDVMFFLLATFIMVSLSMIKNVSVPVALPSAHTAKADKTTNSVAITITKEGKIYWNKEETTLEALPEKLKALEAQQSDAKVFIHGDKEAELGWVVSVLDDIRQAGIQHTAIRTTSAR